MTQEQRALYRLCYLHVSFAAWLGLCFDEPRSRAFAHLFFDDGYAPAITA